MVNVLGFLTLLCVVSACLLVILISLLVWVRGVAALGNSFGVLGIRLGLNLENHFQYLAVHGSGMFCRSSLEVTGSTWI